jgi:hypothetical protein
VSSTVASESEIALAAATFRDHPDWNDPQIYQTLVTHGIARSVAARLVEFLPEAYCRMILEGSGARFSNSFRRRRNDGTLSPAIDLDSEPIWHAAVAYARREIQNGLYRDDNLRLAGRSASFQAANRLLQQGSKLENIAFTPAVLVWDEDGPPVELTSQRPRWRRWF